MRCIAMALHCFANFIDNKKQSESFPKISNLRTAKMPTNKTNANTLCAKGEHFKANLNVCGAIDKHFKANLNVCGAIDKHFKANLNVCGAIDKHFKANLNVFGAKGINCCAKHIKTIAMDNIGGAKHIVQTAKPNEWD